MPFVLPGVVKIPAKNSFAEGAMLEPVNTILKAVKRLNLLPGDTVLVAGQGPIGLMFTKILQLRGIRVLATDLLESRLKLAKKFGAKRAVLASQLSSLNPQLSTGFDAAIIAVPSDEAVAQAFRAVRGGGQILLFAHTKRDSNPQLSTLNFQLSTICVDEKDLIGSYSSDCTLQAEVARLVFSRRLDVRQLITHTFPLEQTAAAVALAAKPTGDSLKILVHVGG